MKLLISILLILLIFPAFSQILKVDISGIKTEKGVIQLSVYRDKETFAAETPFRVYNFPKTGMKVGFSNYYFKGTRKPDFEAFAFQFFEENTTIKIQVQYF